MNERKTVTFLLSSSCSERIGMRQSQVDKLYAGLKDLSEERRGKLDERFRLFQLNREVDDLEQWIAEREVVAGSHELGQDYEHVTVSTTHISLCSENAKLVLFIFGDLFWKLDCVAL